MVHITELVKLIEGNDALRTLLKNIAVHGVYRGGALHVLRDIHSVFQRFFQTFPPGINQNSIQTQPACDIQRDRIAQNDAGLFGGSQS